MHLFNTNNFATLQPWYREALRTAKQMFCIHQTITATNWGSGISLCLQGWNKTWPHYGTWNIGKSQVMIVHVLHCLSILFKLRLQETGLVKIWLCSGESGRGYHSCALWVIHWNVADTWLIITGQISHTSPLHKTSCMPSIMFTMNIHGYTHHPPEEQVLIWR